MLAVLVLLYRNCEIFNIRSFIKRLLPTEHIIDDGDEQSFVFHLHRLKYIVIIRCLFLHMHLPFLIHIIPIWQPKRNQISSSPSTEKEEYSAFVHTVFSISVYAAVF